MAWRWWSPVIRLRDLDRRIIGARDTATDYDEK
jgi:hypothetical protein